MSFLLQFFGYPASRMDPDILRRAVDIFYAPEMTAWRLRPGAQAMLAALRSAGYKLALMTHHNCERVFQRTVDFLGIRPYFDLVVCSGGVEFRKPDVKFLEIALTRWDALPYEVVVVGDSLRHDIAGGIELGALTVLLDVSLDVLLEGGEGRGPAQVQFDNQQLAGQVTPDARIADLGALPDLIQQWATP
jgi:HAD superfamily hydrolase (TIGR01509 family)